ncbi:beta-lactamase [Lentzea sp. NBRC 105346]|uniref:class A beta-lactamase n=1 Tax=Lentzea sp. NBRC 105346 TaxID=3032205 RepID=UPI0024A16176|nr:class A beta-lactamase [Lentzea sp. NBRC 105346]GLZ29199.1 beta-lactamase [Lentzea sp. NBRC 105346]
MKATSRRSALALGAGALLSVAVQGTASASNVTQQLRDLEREHGARLGVFAFDPRTGASVRYRADERFPMCSTFKTLAAAAVLHRGISVDKRVFYTQEDVDKSKYAPKTKYHVADGMTIEELCSAAISFSDNCAGNLLLRELGGPTEVTSFCRHTGDFVTRLDRWEPELNTAEPWRITDTTTPRAIGRTYAKIALGRVLQPQDRERVMGWLLANTTSLNRFRKGLPADWRLADKTGSGDYGTANDVGITWPPGRGPLVLSVLTTKPDPQAPRDEELVARTAAVLAAELS